MACCQSKSDRRRSLLSKLKDLVDHIDDKSGNPSPCFPCVPTPGPVIEIYDPLPKACLPVCSPCPQPCCPAPCCPPSPYPAPCCPPANCCLPQCCPGTCPPPSTPVPCCSPPPTMCPVQLPPCMPICTPVPPPCVPVCNPNPEEQPCVPCNPPAMMVCYRRPSRGDGNGNGNGNLKRCKSREIKSSVLLVGCDCEKRNGLQDDCQRTGCQGSPECLTKPDPTCCPSQYSNGKHLGNGGAHRKDGGKELEEYQCYPAYVKMPSCSPCGPPCGPCPSPCGPYPSPCGPCSPPQCGVACPPPLVPLIAAPPCPPTVLPGPPPYIPVGSVIPTIQCCPQPCCPQPCCPTACCPC